MKRLFILFALLFIIGCAHDPSWIPACRHTALMCAQKVGEQYPVRIMVTKWGDITYGSAYHAQAQFWWKGDWQFLRWDTDADEVRLSDREDPWGSIDRIYTLKEFQQFINQFQYPILKEATWEN
jgi:hypothetical protein